MIVTYKLGADEIALVLIGETTTRISLEVRFWKS